ncbi:MAG: VWA domain-containing protein [Legionellales bacterium]|nr:VWA domain-containing protein [Legionellales bacterium]
MTFHFLRPLWLYGFIPVMGLIILWWLFRERQSNWQRVCDPHLLSHLLNKPIQSSALNWSLLFIALTLSLGIIALAGPTWREIPQATYQTLSSRMIVLDMSNSMNATDLTPSRLARARYKILDLLQHNQGARVGMVVFSGDAFTVSPLTEDANTISLLVPTLATSIMPIAGDNLSSGLQQAAQLLQQSNATDGSIILITDSQPTTHDVQLAQQLHQQGMEISVLGMGREQSVPLRDEQGQLIQDGDGEVVMTHFDPAALAQLAQAGGGLYQTYTTDNSDINAILNSIKTHADATLTKTTHVIWQDEGRWFILFMMIMIALALRRGWLHEVLR